MKPPQVSLDRIGEVAQGLDLVTVFQRLGPVVLVDASNQDAGLRARALAPLHVLEHLQSLRPRGGILRGAAIERETELLLKEDLLRERSRHIFVQIDHTLPVAERAVGEHEVDHESAFDAVERAQLLAYRLEQSPGGLTRFLVLGLLANLREPLLGLLVVSNLGPEYVGLDSGDVAGLPFSDELKQRTIHDTGRCRQRTQLFEPLPETGA